MLRYKFEIGEEVMIVDPAGTYRGRITSRRWSPISYLHKTILPGRYYGVSISGFYRDGNKEMFHWGVYEYREQDLMPTLNDAMSQVEECSLEDAR